MEKFRVRDKEKNKLKENKTSPNKFDEFFKYDLYLEFKNSTSNYIHRKRMIGKEISNLRSNGIVLDIGTGVSPMVNINENIILGDISIHSMRVMKDKGVNCSVLDVTKLGLKNNSIDTVICSEVLEHIPNDTEALREMNRVLRKEGTLILTIPINNYYWLKDDELVGHLRRYNSKDFIRKLEKTGFEITKIKNIGSLTERLTTFLITTVFLSTKIFSVGKNRKNQNLTKKFFWLYKNLNILWAYVISLSSKITHPTLSSITLIKCVKK